VCRDGGSDEVASGIGGSCVVWKRAVRSGGSKPRKAVVMPARLPCSHNTYETFSSTALPLPLHPSSLMPETSSSSPAFSTQPVALRLKLLLQHLHLPVHVFLFLRFSPLTVAQPEHLLFVQSVDGLVLLGVCD